MGTGYTRNDAANNIADGNIINASDLDGEFDAVEAAFNSTTGHTHDGTSAEGAPIEVIGPTQDVVITASVMRPKTTNTVDLGTSSLEFKDAYFDGTITTDALTVTDGITSDTVTISSDNAGAAKGPQLDIFRDSASPADSDVLGYIDFSGKDDGDNKTIYASILAEAADVTDTTEDGVLKFNTMVDGSDTTTMTITESRVGIGESSPDTLLHLTGTSTAYTTVTMEQTDTTLTADQPVGQFLFKQNDASGVGTPAKFGAYAEGTSGEVGFRFSTGSGNTASERMRIDSSGRVLIGTSSSRRTSGGERQFQIEGTTGVTSSMSITRNTNSTTAPSITLAKTRGTSVGDNTIVIDGDTVGQIVFSAADGTDADSRVAEIEAFIDGTPGANDTPGSLVFSTTADGAASTTERMRIDSSGQVGIGTSSPDSLLHLSNSDATAYSGTATDGQVGVGPTIYLENPANANTTVGGQIVFGMRSTEEQARIAATGGTNPAITFGTADAERMRIDSSGNVGVGTSSPSEQINLVGSGGTSKIRFDGDSSNLQNNFIGITGYDDLVIASDEANSATASTIQFRVDATERMRIDSSGKVGIGDTAPDRHLHVNGGTENVVAKFESTDTACSVEFTDSTGTVTLETRNDFRFKTGTNIDMMIDSSGLLRIGNTSGTIYNASSATGIIAGTSLQVSNSAGTVGFFNRLSSDGQILGFYKNGTAVGSISVKDSDLVIGTGDTGFRFIDGSEAIIPQNTSTNSGRDNAIDLGNSGARFDDIFATNGTIQTSDQNEKQQIASLTDAEMTAAKAISKLFKTFKWNDKVEAKGDAARTHTGVIAQQVETAMSDAGLDAGKYAFFISTTWWETQTEVAAVEAVEAVEATYDEDGNVLTEAVEAVEAQDAYTRTDTYETLEEAPEGATERNRKGIRYPELLSFIGAATEQRLTSIEARLDALEG